MDYERRSSEIFCQFRAVITQFNPIPTLEPTPAPQSLPSTPIQESAPIAEPKLESTIRRREFLTHV